MELLLDQIIDLLEMHQLNVIRVNELLEDCSSLITDTDVQNRSALVKKKNIIENRMRMIDETLQRNQIALIGFERLRPSVEKFYSTH